MATAIREAANQLQGYSDEAVHPSKVISLIDQAIHQIPLLNTAGTRVKHALHQAILRGGDSTRNVADLLHGTWLGHPLHAVLTDATIGAWFFGAVFDVLSLARGSYADEQAADTLTTIGVVTAVPTALAGITDYSAIKRDAVSHGALHGILNSSGLVLYLLSLRARKAGNRQQGMALSMIGLGVLGVSAWLGGEMVYRYRVGVNHGEGAAAKEGWMPTMADADLMEGRPERVEVDGKAVLLYRRDGEIYAIGAVCSHAGGPLEEGIFYEGCVQCPWHDSVYDLRDGSVVHGPSTYQQPAYETRVVGDQIEIRARMEQG